MSAVNTVSRQTYAGRIVTAYQKTIESIIEVGKTLQEAKDNLPHGQFEAMIKADLPFGPRQAQKFMAVARHPVLANPNFSSLLPGSITALYHLSQMEPEELTAALREQGRQKNDDDDTFIARILLTKDIKRRLGRPAVTVQGVNREIEKIQEAARQPEPTNAPAPPVTPSPARVTPIPDNQSHFPDKARRAPAPGIEDAVIREVPDEDPRIHAAPPGPENFGNDLAVDRSKKFIGTLAEDLEKIHKRLEHLDLPAILAECRAIGDLYFIKSRDLDYIETQVRGISDSLQIVTSFIDEARQVAAPSHEAMAAIKANPEDGNP